MPCFRIRAEFDGMVSIDLRTGNTSLASLVDDVLDLLEIPSAYTYTVLAEGGLFSSEGFARKGLPAKSIFLSDLLQSDDRIECIIDNEEHSVLQFNCLRISQENCEKIECVTKNVIRSIPSNDKEQDDLPEWLETWDRSAIKKACDGLALDKGQLRRMMSYSVALFGFYLVLPESLAWKLYDQTYPGDVSKESFESFLKIMSHDRAFCYLVPEADGLWLADPEVYDFEDDYERLLEMADTLEWYRPTAEELAPFANDELQTTPQLSQLCAYLIHQRDCDPDDLYDVVVPNMISQSTLMDGDPDRVYPAEWEDHDAPGELRDLYQQAVNSLRTPLLHGFTRKEAGKPYKLSLKKAMQTQTVLWKPGHR